MANDEHMELPPNVSDHDLLIVLHTTMKHMSRDITAIKDDNTQRLAVVEATKYDKEDAQKALADAAAEHKDLSDRINTKQSKDDAQTTQAANKEVHKDHEERMRKMERNMYIAIGGLALLQIILSFAK